MDGENVVDTQWNFSDIKKNNVVVLTGKWMQLEIIMLSKLSQSQNKYCVFSLIHGI